MAECFFERALLPSGWAEGVVVDINAVGDIVSVAQSECPAAVQRIKGVAIAGMPNVHSHAFQRAMAGLTEHIADEGDNFWSWRQLMYDFSAKITAEQLQAIATRLYIEMLKAGYTAVAEFHYLHHAPDDKPYDDPGHMSHAIARAARETGIGLTLLPVLYQQAGFGKQAPEAGQKRFIHSVESYLKLIEKLQSTYHTGSQIQIGIAPHSLRAVAPEALLEVTQSFRRDSANGPIHIHIAEQLREVEQCQAWSGCRPVEWLLKNLSPDERWCLIHATHINAEERRGIAASGATVGLCPTTEANLGDGIFPLQEYLDEQGGIAVGSDSNASVSPVEELRWLEYGQRLIRQRRNISADANCPSVGRNLWERCTAGGVRALARPVGCIAPDHRADFIVLDSAHPLLAGRTDDALLDSFLFAGNTSLVRDVMVGGKWVVKDFEHPLEARANRDFIRTIKEIQT